LSRYIATPRVAKHRQFVWLDRRVLPDSRLYAIAREDDTTFGILHSRVHEVRTYATCSWHGVGNDPTYNAYSVFETYPFPEGFTPNVPAADYASDPRAVAIAEAAKVLVNLRDARLNPPDWVDRVPEVVATRTDWYRRAERP
jgi:type II restriction/modification system DNA methylase subunit YeeA